MANDSAPKRQRTPCEARPFAFLAIVSFLVVPIQSSAQVESITWYQVPRFEETRKPKIEPCGTSMLTSFKAVCSAYRFITC